MRRTVLKEISACHIGPIKSYCEHDVVEVIVIHAGTERRDAGFQAPAKRNLFVISSTGSDRITLKPVRENEHY